VSFLAMIFFLSAEALIGLGMNQLIN